MASKKKIGKREHNIGLHVSRVSKFYQIRGRFYPSTIVYVPFNILVENFIQFFWGLKFDNIEVMRIIIIIMIMTEITITAINTDIFVCTSRSRQ